MNSYKENDMELCKEILIRAFRSDEAQVFFPELQVDAAKIVKMECYRLLREIQAVVEDDSLRDAECFRQIEEIVSVLNEAGIDTGRRHN